MQKRNNKYKKLFVVTLFFVLVSMSAAQALVKNNTSDDRIANDPPTQPLGDPFFVWEDEFETLEFIDPDPTLSYDFELFDGSIQMKNTYSFWTDPAWTRLKQIEITNNAGSPLSNYAVHLTVDYD